MTPEEAKEGPAKADGTCLIVGASFIRECNSKLVAEQLAININRALSPLLRRAELAGRMHAAIAHYKMMKVNEDIGPYLDEFDAVLTAWDAIKGDGDA